MCGIAGIYSEKNLHPSFIDEMITTLSHRGPDDNGKFLSSNMKLLLGHSRLSIIDLSSRGSQPMKSHSSRYCITYNGEIYNSFTLKQQIKTHSPKVIFNGTSDTEILLAYIETFGLQKALSNIKGMFSFALWDSKNEELILARDIAGEKPLYYGYINGDLYFASELKAIKNKIGKLAVSHKAIRLMLKYNCIPTPYSIYENVYKVEPSSYLKFKNPSQPPTIVKYFSPNTSLANDQRSGYLAQLEHLVNDSVKSQMVSDVPIGSFLSGGVDSSLITYYMQKNSNKPVNTFSVGFKDYSYDEAPYSKIIASAIGTNHNEIYIDDHSIKELIYKLPEIYCEPFSDSSQIPTYFVSKLASESVKVCLTGDAGDELFGGYNRYLFAYRYWNKLRLSPKFLKMFLSLSLLNFPSNRIELFSRGVYKFLRKKMPSDFGGKIHKFAQALRASSLQEYHDITTTHWDQNSMIYFHQDFVLPKLYRDNASKLQSIEDMLLADFYGFLHDDSLCKVDRASMSVSLETRAPFLDKDLINFAYSLPLDSKITANKSKVLLKKLLFKKLPKNLFERPKSGFAIPIHHWMRQDLSDWIEYLLDLKMEDNELINYEEVNKIWHQFKKGNNSHTYPLWDIVMLRAWLEKN